MSTSVTGFSSDPNKMYKNSFHWRNDSGELDVFEAAGYFSSVNIDQNPGYIISDANFAQKFIREEKQHVQRAAAARMSLDVPMRNPIPAEYHHIMDQKQMIKENKKHKQPSSPGGRLASFLNSLFSQTHLKKKKSKSGGTMKDGLEEESPGGRRKRRSSISHFRITSSSSSSTMISTAASTDSKSSSSLFSSSSSGFRTPPPYANTPTKSYKEFRNLADLQRAISRPENSGNFKPTLEKKVTDYAWMEEKLRISGGDPGKISRNGNSGAIPTRNSTTNWEFRKFSNADDGADSDSSSDLFDLPSHELDFYSSSLPVYETTHLDRIKIGTQLPSAATV
ncbi:protein BIG GRAIN 1-like E [Sesamum alatum]|uniref:Protein BIG GRAIN 1-like E n=1 Tax=Sesamum alatum TaxID=300844 RepID=A0AAE1Y4L7_9LAMI|nr:protein BIG GRAIN 1-like E [Sesamum alatum]